MTTIARTGRARPRSYKHRRTGRPISEITITAFHEAGHSVVGAVLGLRVKEAGLEPEPGDGFTAHTHHRRLDWLFGWIELRHAARDARMRIVASPPRLTLARRETLRRHLVMCCAGIASEARLLGGRASQRWSEGHGDWLDAHFALACLPARERRPTLDAARLDARRLVERHWYAVEAVARRLRRRERVSQWRPVSGREVRTIVRRAGR